MPSDELVESPRHVCAVCGDTYERKVVGLNGINSCYCGGTLRRARR